MLIQLDFACYFLTNEPYLSLFFICLHWKQTIFLKFFNYLLVLRLSCAAAIESLANLMKV